MLSAVILPEHSYRAVLLAEQLVHQRFVLPGPLVLGKRSLKQWRPQQIGDQPVSRIITQPFFRILRKMIPHPLPDVWTIPPSHFRDDRRVSPLPGTVIWRGLLLCPKAVESLYGVNIRFFLFLE